MQRLTRRTFSIGLGALAIAGVAPAGQNSSSGSLHIPRYGPALATDGRSAILSGGAPIGAENNDEHYYSSLLGIVESIDPLSLRQHFLANALFVRANHAAVWLDERLWLLGGRTRIGAEGRLAAETERIDLQTQAIWRGPDLPRALIHLSAVTFGNSVFVFGGVYRDRDTQTSAVSEKVYECAPPYSEWQERAPMQVALGNCAAVASGDSIHVIGGYDRAKAHALTQVFDPQGNSWRLGPPPPLPLSAHGAAAHNGRIFSFGDYANQSTVLGLDIRSGTWRSLDVPFTPRRHVRAVTVGDTVIVAGGNQSSYAPATDALEAFPAGLLHDAFDAAA